MQQNSSLLDEELTVAVQDAACQIGAEAVGGSGVGLDLYAGERVIAALLMRNTPRHYEHRLAVAVTDRRTAVSGWSSIKGNHNGKSSSLLHAHLQRVEAKDSLLSTYVRLFGPGVTLELSITDHTRKLEQLYQGMQMIPPPLRAEPPTPFVTPSEEDPSGARTAAMQLWRPDPPAADMLRAVGELVHAGQIDPQAGADLVRRIVLAHRSSCDGPAMQDGIWLSPMSADDLGFTLRHVFGAPAAQRQVAPGRWAFDFYVPPGSDPLGKALTALGVASYLTIGFGYSVGGVIADQLMKKEPFTRFTVELADLPSACGYRLYTPAGPIEREEALFAHSFHQTLIATAYRVLERRAHVGWGRPPANLFD